MSSYPGGKGNRHQPIINLIPPHKIYIEPFFGGGTIMKMKRRARLNIGSDIDGDVINAFAAENPDSQIYDLLNPTPVDFIAAEDGCIHLVMADAMDMIAKFKDNPNAQIYLDPPYLGRTRAGGFRHIYKHEMLYPTEHRSLLNLIADAKAKILISGYADPLYDEMLADWNTESFTAQTRSGKAATEWLWFNYDRPTELHDYRYLGDDYRERERIKKKKNRWVAKFRDMPEMERQAILWAMGEAGVL